MPPQTGQVENYVHSLFSERFVQVRTGSCNPTDQPYIDRVKMCTSHDETTAVGSLRRRSSSRFWGGLYRSLEADTRHGSDWHRPLGAVVQALDSHLLAFGRHWWRVLGSGNRARAPLSYFTATHRYHPLRTVGSLAAVDSAAHLARRALLRSSSSVCWG